MIESSGVPLTLDRTEILPTRPNPSIVPLPSAPDPTEQISRPARRWLYRLGLAAIVGVIAGIAAAVLEWALVGGHAALAGNFTHLGSAEVFHFDWRIVLLPAAGCLLAGLVTYLFAPQPYGRGVDLLTRAFHRQYGHMPLRSASVKAGGAALVVSSGGCAGIQSPIAALGAALGSTIGRLFGVNPRYRRALLLAGCAAGIGAIFRCPLGGALFATSILYREPEFESDAIVPSFVASVLGYAVYMGFWGFEDPLLPLGEVRFTSAAELPWYAALGVVCGLAAIFFYYCLTMIEDRIVPRLRMPLWATAALGGLATGTLALLIPQVMDSQYAFLRNILAGLAEVPDAPGHLGAWILLLVAVIIAKCVATGFTVGSGAPGGVLGPSMFIGGATGALLGVIGLALFPDAIDEPLRQALIPVGMAGFFAAVMRSPLAAIVMVTEITGAFGLIAPLMLVCGISYVIARRHGLNREQVRSAADSPVHAADPMIHILESWRIEQVMQRQWPMTVDPDTPVEQIVKRIEPGTRPVIAVARNEHLVGLISAADLGHIMEQMQVAPILVASDIMQRQYRCVEADENVYNALQSFSDTEHEVLPVLSRDPDRRWLGMFSRRHVVDALFERLGQIQASVFSEHESLIAIQPELRAGQLLAGTVSRHARVERLFVPMQCLGKSLRASDFANQFNAQVIAVEQRDGTLQCPPDPDSPLRSDHRLIAVVWTEQDEAAETGR